MSCKECERLRSKLSPFEDKHFTADYLLVEPLEWLSTLPEVSYNGRPAVAVQLSDLWDQFNDAPANTADLTRLGRTLVALGWSRTKRQGDLYFVMEKGEFDDYRTARAN